MGKDYRYRACCICGKSGTSKSVKPTNWMDPNAPWAHPSCWQKFLAEQAEANREQQRQSHLAIKKFWIDGPPSPRPKTETPGSGAYNAKHGFER